MAVRATLGAWLLALTACASSAAWYEVMTLHLSTNDGPVALSQSVAVSFDPAQVWAGALDSDDVQIAGRALVVSLGGPVLAVPFDDRTGWRVWRARYALRLTDTTMGADLQGVMAQEEALPLPRDLWPALVAFTDPHDAVSLVLVDPTDMAAVFGQGMMLERITVQARQEPAAPTTPISALLPWWGDANVPLGDGIRRSYGHPLNGLRRRDFVREAS
ncbi:hypothetical protein KDD17_04275 [Sulfitobacter albidus]|uniref:Uncharacterized protein n=1 Tax=Sulfitobacter albidus TaxID=2829501 RepID=A0A975PN98_9RHOB|nr:hypothetical protein [Sulfitobacter albidus]QUJ77241.1 hypothetical protein KDD17_04275 [Sulfitobacter albidus]